MSNRIQNIECDIIFRAFHYILSVFWPNNAIEKPKKYNAIENTIIYNLK